VESLLAAALDDVQGNAEYRELARGISSPRSSAEASVPASTASSRSSAFPSRWTSHATTSWSRGERAPRRRRGTDQRHQALAADAGAGHGRRRQPHLEGRGARRWHRGEPTQKVTGCKAWPIVWRHSAAGCTSALRAPEDPPDRGATAAGL